ncbi:MAG: hypothetical protein M3319_15620, partial [Actinomycetota bacterium]|nr:hypothetical protein [Actinomycetota bacterium]
MNSRTQPDSTGRNEDRPTTWSVLVRALCGIEHAHAYARWTGRTLRIEVEGWVDPTLPVHDGDELGCVVSDAIHDAVPEARAIS